MSNLDKCKALTKEGRLEIPSIDRINQVTPCDDPIDKNRLRGMLLGLAVGDSLGNTTESLIPTNRFKLRGEVTDYLGNWHASGRSVGFHWRMPTTPSIRTTVHLQCLCGGGTGCM